VTEGNGEASGGAGAGALRITGGGQVTVATEELHALADRMEAVASEVHDARSRLVGLQVVVDGAVAARAPDAHHSATLSVAQLGEVELASTALSRALRVAAAGYGVVEHSILETGLAAGGELGYDFGRLAPLLTIAAPELAGTAAAFLLGLSIAPGGPRGPADLGNWLREHPRLLNNPFTASVVRMIMSSSDEFIAGAMGAPRGLEAAIGDRGLGVFGIQQAADVVLAHTSSVGGVTGGALKETPVRTTAQSVGQVVPPASLEELVDRMPRTQDGGDQIRIERYPGEGGEQGGEQGGGQGGGPGGGSGSKWIVYLGGTVDLGLQPGVEPFDMTSNIQSMAGLHAGSYRAATQAMADAGVAPGDPVFVAGYSQGGIVAVELERSGGYNVDGVLTLGSPVGQIPTEAPTATLAHTEDIIPALGGVDSATGDNRIAAMRSLYDDAPIPSGDAIPAHSLDEYATTASLLDSSSDPRAAAYRDSVAGFIGGDTAGTATLVRADRLTREFR
jgi:hypothetical protein